MNIGNPHAHKALTLEQYCQSQPDHVHDPEELLVIVLPHLSTCVHRADVRTACDGTVQWPATAVEAVAQIT